MSKWTLFWDMHSGGGLKEKWDKIYIEAPEEEAKVIFYNRFGHNPDRVSCTCCGNDYSVDEYDSLKRASAYHRGCLSLETPKDKKGLYKNDLNDTWFHEHYYLDNEEELKEAEKRGYTLSSFNMGRKIKDVVSLEDYINQDDVLVIYDKDIKPHEREGELPEQGFVWID